MYDVRRAGQTNAPLCRLTLLPAVRARGAKAVGERHEVPHDEQDRGRDCGGQCRPWGAEQ